MNNVLRYLEKTANQFPEQIAVADENTELTYSELRNRTQEIGAKIHKEEGSGNPIGILADRSCETIIAILSVLYSGNYYLPIDPALPERKFLSILQDSGIHLLIVPNVSDFKEKCNLFTGRIFFISNMQCCGSCPKYLPLSEDLPLCLMYTSGSTGKPKGVLKSHKAICSYIESFTSVFAVHETDVIGNQTPFYFDASAKDIYLSLKTGARLEIIPTKLFMFPVNLIRWMNERRVTLISWVPSALSVVTQLNTFSEVKPLFLRQVFFVGESFSIKQLNRWRSNLPDVSFVNLYGSTEIAGVCCNYTVTDVSAEQSLLPIGKPFPDMEVFLLQGSDICCKEGEIGEVCISGPTLALGYWRDPENTNRSFFLRMTPSGQIRRCFLTGDLAKYDSNRNLIFVSRKDQQIKHMGHRIELGEIEHAAATVPGITSACCLFDEKRNKLILFAESSNRETSDSRKIREYLRRFLPEYMIPHKVVCMDKLPHNANGKIDRQNLKLQL